MKEEEKKSAPYKLMLKDKDQQADYEAIIIESMNEMDKQMSVFTENSKKFLNLVMEGDPSINGYNFPEATKAADKCLKAYGSTKL